MKSLLLAIIAMPGSFAYVTSVSAPAAVSIPTFLPPPTDPQRKNDARATYDLGLGKNLPVSGGRKVPYNQMSAYDASRFWNVPEAVNNYPSPIVKPVAPRKLQSIVPVRLGNDLVDISGGNDEVKAVLRVKSVELDVNTLWVEMFIHDQRKKLILSDATKPFVSSEM
jgi:hypothetical protein